MNRAEIIREVFQTGLEQVAYRDDTEVGRNAAISFEFDLLQSGALDSMLRRYDELKGVKG